MCSFMIKKVNAREILDSRGNPTLEAEVILAKYNENQQNAQDYAEYYGRAAVPSGASCGRFEAVELRDGGKRYGGKGVLRAVANVNNTIKEALLGKVITTQKELDEELLALDKSENKSMLGANAMLGVSMAAARALAKGRGLRLYESLSNADIYTLPKPMMNILNGGAHSNNLIDFQEFMIIPIRAIGYREGLRIGSEVYHCLKSILSEDGHSTAVGDEGGFAPELKDAFEVFDYLMRAVRKAGYEPGTDIAFAMDAAASELHNEETGMYIFSGESKLTGKSVVRSSREMIAYYKKLVETYPLISIEDGLDEEDWEGWQELTAELGNQVQLVGDDLFVTNPVRLAEGIRQGAGNAILIKLNQIGTVAETLATINMAQEAGYKTIISHRSGETEDTFIADLSVAVNAGQIKTGAPCRSDRVAKYNRLLRIQEDIEEML